MTGLIEGTLCRLEGQLSGRVSRPGDNRYVASAAVTGGQRASARPSITIADRDLWVDRARGASRPVCTEN